MQFFFKENVVYFQIVTAQKKYFLKLSFENQEKKQENASKKNLMV